MFSIESTCNPHKNKLSGKRYNKKVSATHTIVHTSWNQQITSPRNPQKNNNKYSHTHTFYTRSTFYFECTMKENIDGFERKVLRTSKYNSIAYKYKYYYFTTTTSPFLSWAILNAIHNQYQNHLMPRQASLIHNSNLLRILEAK